MVPITGRASSFLEIKTPISIQIKSKSYPIQFLLFLLPLLQGQPELCGSYHLLQSCFSFFVRLHGRLVATIFSSLALLSSSISTANLATNFSSLSFLSNSLSWHHFNLLGVARRCFLWSSVSVDLLFSSCSFWVILLALSYSRPILSLSFICSSVSDALFALSFSFKVNIFFFGFFFIHAKTTLAYSREIRVSQVGFDLADEGRIKVSKRHFVSNSQNWLWACACLDHIIPPTHFGIPLFCMGFP